MVEEFTEIAGGVALPCLLAFFGAGCHAVAATVLAACAVMRHNSGRQLSTAAIHPHPKNALNQSYDPSRLLAALSHRLHTESDKKLAKMLGFSAGIIAGLRAGRMAITATMYLQMQEKTGLPVETLRSLSGDRRHRHRPTGARPPGLAPERR